MHKLEMYTLIINLQLSCNENDESNNQKTKETFRKIYNTTVNRLHGNSIGSEDDACYWRRSAAQ